MPPVDERPLVTIYVTRNRRAPIIGLVDQWPSRAGFSKMARAGERILVRPATEDEAEHAAASPRYTCVVWQSLLGLARDVKEHFGQAGIDVLLKNVRHKREVIRACFQEQQKKRRKHAAKLAARRKARG